MPIRENSERGILQANTRLQMSTTPVVAAQRNIRRNISRPPA